MLEKVQTKQCPRCLRKLPRAEFSVRHTRSGTYPQSYCRTCKREEARHRLGLTQKFLPHVRRVEDIRSQVFGNYTVLEFAGLAPTNRVSKWLCRCVCGAGHVVFKTALRPGHIYCPTCHPNRSLT